MNSRELLKWYEVNKRDLPWRSTKDPYKIWISEIILQQTRVNQGLQYYYRFIEAFPSIEALANASIDKVLSLWQGLGYYSRARNLHETAKAILYIYKGIFPSTFEEILKLKGIGKYTAGAIASITFNEKVPVVDGNVYRVISRYFGIASSIDNSGAYKLFAEKALEFIGENNPGEMNQAIMELGALVCCAAKPLCTECPLQQNCFAFLHGMQNEFPVRSKEQKISNRFFNYLVVSSKDSVLLHQRNKKDIWKGLFEFPLIESSKILETTEILKHEYVKSLNVADLKLSEVSKVQKVKLSHQHIEVQFVRFICNQNHPSGPSMQWIKLQDIGEYALPACISKYFKNEFCL